MAKIFTIGSTKIQKVKNTNGSNYLRIWSKDKSSVICYTERLYINLPKEKEKCLKELYLDFQL